MRGPPAESRKVVDGAVGAMGKGKTSLPDRWTDYLPLGRRISGTRFIAFKVPLKRTFDWRLAPEERFSPLDLITQVREQKEELGLIIDLTYTTRYYEPAELPDTLQYCKILTVGHEVPDNATVLKFKSTVNKFLQENQHNDTLIGVHCTHGLNRTGYLVCRYLIDVEGIDPNVAIELFNRCRGHSIERKNYISALRRNPQKRNPHCKAASQWNWTGGDVGHTISTNSEVSEYKPQDCEKEPRHSSPRRSKGRRTQIQSRQQNQNLITCYDGSKHVCSPQLSPAVSHISPGLAPGNWLFYSSYQQQQQHLQQLQGYQRPSFQIQNPHSSLQSRQQLGRPAFWIP